MSRKVAIILVLCLLRQTYNASAANTKDAAINSGSPTFSAAKFKNDPAGLHFLTRLENYQQFTCVLCTLAQAACHLTYLYGPASDSIFVPDSFFLVLVKLRKHYSHFELSCLFAVSEANVYNISFVRGSNSCHISGENAHFGFHKILSRSAQHLDFKTTRVLIDGTKMNNTECCLNNQLLQLLVVRVNKG